MDIGEKLYEPNTDRTTRSVTADERHHIPNITPGLPADHSGERKPVRFYETPVSPTEAYFCDRPPFTRTTSPLADY